MNKHDAAPNAHDMTNDPAQQLELDLTQLGDQAALDAEEAPDEPVKVAKGEAEPGYKHPGFKWLDEAACGKLDLEQQEFFVDAGHVMAERAKSACMTCTVWQECTIFSYLGAPDGKLISGGYFAGLSLGQRRKMTLGEALAYGREMREAAGTLSPAAV